ncbi:hypothetical protein GRAN_1253 [Granulicella sibirica]|uniref:Uncharacterized protein n=1 Tax=Granulicella sibirica TaxID=2479048 RepID=A0A4Q0T2U1_9BACT|nr:hypothetical protein GRAN_1253 [Granulicella sibirica]
MLLFAVAACLAFPLHGQAQSQPALPDALSAPPQIDTTVTVYAHETEAERREWIHSIAAQELKAEEQQRILTVVPNFNTVISGLAMPLSSGQKLDLAVHNAVDPFNIVGAVVLAGASELTDTHPGYGWGPGGFAKRTGGNYADVTDGTMLSGAVFPILLHQDPRFFRQGTGSISSRVRHALSAPFICRGDNGLTQVNASNILGSFTAGAISNAYYPANERGVGLTLVNSSVVMLEGALGSVGLEFAPDVGAWWKNRKNRRSEP